ncbi:MAG: MerR family transcriptional regulator [Firmicutes bacterium]|nr:MerR family transcriptional regulator [Bacillota bacterium]
MQEKRYKISEVAARIGISPSIIRHYEEKGLVSPIKDPENGYRLFSEEDIYKIWDVTFFRSFDMGLEHIDSLFRGCDLDKRIGIISDHRDCLETLLGKAKRNILLCDFTARYAHRAKEVEKDPYVSAREVYQLYPEEDFYDRSSSSFPLCTFGGVINGETVSRYTMVFDDDMQYLELDRGEELVIENTVVVTVCSDQYPDPQKPLEIALKKANDAGFAVEPPYYYIFLLNQGWDSGEKEYYYRILLSQKSI